jgi:type III secretion protein J
MTTVGRPCLALILLASACSVPIAADLGEADANQVVVALEENGVAAKKQVDPSTEGRWQVVVARDDASSAARVLKHEELPPPGSPRLLEALGKGSIVPSRTSEHARLVAGTAGELERSLHGIDGILAARVHLALPHADPLAMQQQHAPSASVLLRHRGASCPLSGDDVKRLVAGAVAGLSAERVSVVTTPVAALQPRPERQLAHFGPITVARSSMPALRALVGAAVGLNVLLIAVLLLVWSRMRRTRGSPDQADPSAAAAQQGSD